ncbi:nusA antitermination factor [Corallococcus sp. CAG:1435]|uniref:Transcription termination/antitermination protein NusA n=1 Tax=Candidatus Fimimonas gallinarum TaxID=2840821 RepID=A0A9D1E4Y1_9BACT|nr:nusA antitermination factor [Corallococcus sp. CAG:1435]HIR66285.1 transcription termination/antitermination protein NusA [Candidatus Fimimonas gallinarum]
MTSKDFFLALDELEKEKGISKEKVIESLETALAIACKKNFGEASRVVVKTNPEKFSIRVFISKTVVEEVVEPESQISLDDAREIKKSYKLGDEVLTELDPRTFGRIAAQNARQVIINSLHQAEKDVTYNQFADKESELIVGVVSRVKEDGTIYVEIGKNQMEGVLTVQEQIPGEKFQAGDRIKVLVKRVRDSVGGTQVMLSRANYMFIKRLFENEVPEIRAEIVQIKNIVREAGFRTKMAVYSTDPDIDAVGACVGNKGARVNAIVSEIGGEKIDIIPWSSDILDYIARALSPAKVLIVQADEDKKEAKVIVPDEKLSLAIGKEGQNARLAARLTGWKIDVKSYTAAMQSGMFDDIHENEEG